MENARKTARALQRCAQNGNSGLFGGGGGGWFWGGRQGSGEGKGGRGGVLSPFSFYVSVFTAYLPC